VVRLNMNNPVIQFILFLYDLLMPRFIVENVAFIENDKGVLEPFCREADLRPNEAFDVIKPVKSFNFFGFALFSKLVEQDKAK